MAEPFLSEIRIMSFNFAPKGWAMCNGQMLPINQNQALFSLLGTTYGGNGQTTFALPNLQGRVPIHMGEGYTLGQNGGEQAHTLRMAEVPQHIHMLTASTADGAAVVPAGNLLAVTNNQLYRNTQSDLTTLSPSSVSSAGGSQPHINMQPSLTLNFCIPLQSIFPSRN